MNINRRNMLSCNVRTALLIITSVPGGALGPRQAKEPISPTVTTTQSPAKTPFRAATVIQEIQKIKEDIVLLKEATKPAPSPTPIPTPPKPRRPVSGFKFTLSPTPTPTPSPAPTPVPIPFRNYPPQNPIPYTPDSPYFPKDLSVMGHDVLGEDPQIREKRHYVREIFRHAFNGYASLCFGKGEVKPISGECNTFWREYVGSEPLNLGLTIIDSLDTMLIMGETHFYKKSRDWIASTLDWDAPITVSVFEVTIRCLGGLLSAYEMTLDNVLLRAAEDLANRFTEAFDTKTRIPWTYSPLRPDPYPSRGSTSNLAEAGSIQLEFTTLSHLLNTTKYAKNALAIYKSLYQFRPQNSWIFPKRIIDVQTLPLLFDGERGVNGEADSFYEYLLKLWLINDKTDDMLGKWWHETADEIVETLVHKIEIGGTPMAYVSSGTEQGHLECFMGGVFGLASEHADSPERKKKYLETGELLATFCHELYTQRNGPFSGLPVEQVEVIARTVLNKTSYAIQVIDDSYLQRPEAVESWFVLWRITKRQRYRDWGWDYAQGLEATKRPSGYYGLGRTGYEDDVQQSFFLAETLKYLYLLFCSDDVLPLSEWTFTTEAHPLKRFNPKTTYNLTLNDIPDLRNLPEAYYGEPPSLYTAPTPLEQSEKKNQK